jgi:hypothetical protein
MVAGSEFDESIVFGEVSERGAADPSRRFLEIHRAVKSYCHLPTPSSFPRSRSKVFKAR